MSRFGPDGAGSLFSEDARRKDTKKETIMASYPESTPNPVFRTRPEGDSGAGLKILALFLGIAVAVMAVVGLVLLSATLGARHDARDAAAKAEAAATMQSSMPGMEMPTAAPRTAAGEGAF